MTGKIVELKLAEGLGGWGFIKPEEAGTGVGRVYFNSSGLQRTTRAFHELELGDRVEFTLIEHPKGPRAIEMRVL